MIDRMKEYQAYGAQIARLAVPVLLCGLLTQSYPALTLLLAGRFAGDGSVAAIGASDTLTTLLSAFSVAAASGAGISLSRRLGAEDAPGARAVASASLALACLTGCLLAVAGFLLAPAILAWMNTPRGVLREAAEALRVQCLGLPAFVTYLFSFSLLQARGDAKRPIVYLAACLALCGGLATLLLGVFSMGAPGAMLAAVLSQYTCCLLSLGRLRRRGLLAAPKLCNARECVRLGFPAGLQTAGASLSNILIQACLNAYGEAALAANAAVSRINSYIYMTVTACAIAAAMLAGERAGAGDSRGVSVSARAALALCALCVLPFSAFFALRGDLALSLFVTGAEAAALGALQLKITAGLYLICVPYETFSAVLRARGDALKPMLISIMCMCVFRVGFVYALQAFGAGIAGVYAGYPAAWLLATLAISARYIGSTAQV